MTLILLNWSVVKLFIKPVVLHFLLSFLDAFYSHFLRTLFIGIGVGYFISVWVEMYWHIWVVLIAGWRNFTNIFSFSFSIMVGYISIIEKLCLIELFCCYSFKSLLFFLQLHIFSHTSLSSSLRVWCTNHFHPLPSIHFTPFCPQFIKYFPFNRLLLISIKSTKIVYKHFIQFIWTWYCFSLYCCNSSSLLNLLLLVPIFYFFNCAFLFH